MQILGPSDDDGIITASYGGMASASFHRAGCAVQGLWTPAEAVVG